MNKSTEKIKKFIESFTKFSFTGILSMLIDQGLFALFVNWIFKFLGTEKAIVISTIIARICSSVFNYIMNRNVVFKSKSGLNSLIRYYTLCIVQMMASALGVMLIYKVTKGNSSILKLIVDLLLFFVSYQIQRKWVFADKE